MTSSEAMKRIATVLLATAPAFSEEALSLRDAVELALRTSPAIAAADAASAGSASRVTQAGAHRLPRINYTETATRGNNPVYVFSSLLTQRQFSAANFDLDALNRPDALNNFQSLVAVDQVLWDAGRAASAMETAKVGTKMTAEERRRVEMEVISGVARAYYGALLAAENLKAAAGAVRSAEADLRRAEAFRNAGMSTDADVLSIRVHLAGVNEQRINRTAEVEVAKAALNDALGLPLDTSHHLVTELAVLDVPELELQVLEASASNSRPESRQSALAQDLAHAQSRSAKSAMLPQVSVRAALEADRQRFVTRGGSNWLAGVSLQWNLFNGFADKARIEEASHMLRRTQADRQRTDSAVRLQVRRAHAALRAAEQRIEAAKASVAEAEESLRITKNRYDAGMANVTDLLRNETAALESRTRYLAAIHDQRIAATLLEAAAGRLNAVSEVLN
jgi:outer membrane protein TolC